LQKLVDKIFRKYGVPITVQTDQGTYEVNGFVQNAATSARKYLLTEYSPLGEIPQGFYVILLPRYEARLGRHVMYGDKWCIIRRVERVWFRNQALYDWCLCEERGKLDTWGN
jgi:hypothetical protein